MKLYLGLKIIYSTPITNINKINDGSNEMINGKNNNIFVVIGNAM